MSDIDHEKEIMVLHYIYGISEGRCRVIIETIFNKRFPKSYPDFLINPNGTSQNRQLEFDCYNDELKIALEYHGKCHEKNTRVQNIKRTPEMNMASDNVKKKLCQERGIKLIIVTHEYCKRNSQKRDVDLKKYIIKLLKEQDIELPDGYQTRLDKINSQNVTDSMVHNFRIKINEEYQRCLKIYDFKQTKRLQKNNKNNVNRGSRDKSKCFKWLMNMSDKDILKCHMGHRFEASLRGLMRVTKYPCSKCAKYSIKETMKELQEGLDDMEIDLTVIDLDYNWMATLECPQYHKITYNMNEIPIKCPVCKGEEHKLQESYKIEILGSHKGEKLIAHTTIADMVTKNNSQIISNYINAHTPILIQCSEGHKEIHTPNDYSRIDVKCVECHKLNKIKDVNKNLKKKNVKCLKSYGDNFHKDPVLLECQKKECKYKWKTQIQHINKANSGCPQCNGVAKGSNTKMIIIATEKEGKWLSTKYEGSRELYEWECKRGHTFMKKPHQAKKYWCQEGECAIKTNHIPRITEIIHSHYPDARILTEKCAKISDLIKIECAHKTWESRGSSFTGKHFRWACRTCSSK